jgi:hypothetical protein
MINTSFNRNWKPFWRRRIISRASTAINSLAR